MGWCMFTFFMFGFALAVTSLAKDLRQVETRNLVQFKNMIKFATGKGGLKVFKYADYGCWCGWGGRGKPVDELDKCCKIHDECYERVGKKKLCNPKLRSYNWRKKGNKIECYAGFADGKCNVEICGCDRDAAHCFAKHPFQKKYHKYDHKKC